MVPTLTVLQPLNPAYTVNRSWYVVQCEAQREQLAHDEISNRRFDVYWPRQQHRVTRRRVVGKPRHTHVQRSMFPGYLFAGFDAAEEEWPIITALRGVRRVLMIDLRPVPVAFHIIAHIREREALNRIKGGNGMQTHAPVTLNIGSIVRINEPLAFAGLFGQVIEHRGDRIRVEIDLFGRLVPLEITPESVEAT